MSRRRLGHWEIAVVVEAVLLALWSREPSYPLAVAAGLAWIGVVVGAARHRRVRALITAVAAGTAAASVLAVSVDVRRVERRWTDEREALIQQAGRELESSLAAAVELARSTADAGAAVVDLPRPDALETLQRTVGDGGYEHGVAVLDAVNRPWVWAGRHRIRADARPRELTASITPFYVVLEARRQIGTFTAVGQVLLAADSAVPDRSGALAHRFSEATGFRLEFFDPAAAPLGTDVFDYCLPSCEATGGVSPPDTLFSLRAIPPSQGSRKLELLAAGERWVGLTTTVMLIALALLGGGIGRWCGLLGLVGLLVFTPAGQHIGLETLFSPASYYLDLLGPFSSSAGALFLLSMLVAVLALHRPSRTVPRSPVRRVLAFALIVAAPWVLGLLATGVSPPVTGTPFGGWVAWQGTLTVAGAAILLVASRLLAGETRPPAWVLPLVGVAMPALAVLGLYWWRPPGSWPVAFGICWMPVAWLAALPQHRLRHLVGVGLVAGTGAGLLTWGQAVQGRLLLAERDARRVEGGDPVAIGFLERFADDLLAGPHPRTAAELYSDWRRSPLSIEDYPGILAVWEPTGELGAVLRLSELDIGIPELAEVAEVSLDSLYPILRTLTPSMGVHYAIAVPFADGAVVAVAVAPRSQLMRPVLVGRFLRGERRLYAPYTMRLGEPMPGRQGGPEDVWERIGWTIRRGWVVSVEGGPAQHLHVRIDLQDLAHLLVRGALLVVLDVVLMLALGLFGSGIAGQLHLPVGWPEGVRFRSYRNRLALALAGFFVIPTLGFASWSVGRLRTEAVRGRDLLIQQTLSDAAGSAEGFAGAGVGISVPLGELADRLNTDLLWYEDGDLVAATADVLVQLGLLDPYLPPDVYLSLAERDELELTSDAVIGGQLTRVGYRALASVQPGLVALAAPRLVELSDIQREQEDLLYGLLLVTVLGLGGAIGLAAFASQTLASPVQSLESAAGAVGRGDMVPPFEEDIPTEFVSVVRAFERMARDVEASQTALEAARRRTATVLSTVATGVIALDESMLVTIANPAAQAVLHTPLPPGAAIDTLTSAAWDPVWAWVEQVQRAPESQGGRDEFTVGGRRIRVQVALLQADPRGCVVALDDVTDVTNAVRVLAWGEVARQVAHEIKNPLTPIRLGVQHLQRARRQGSADFDATLERTAQQILAEIERLDAIARAFARFGAPPTEETPVEAVDLVHVAADTAALYALGGQTSVTVEADGEIFGRARKDEVKEVLINLVENARDAGAGRVTIAVREGESGTAVLAVHDDGTGIPEADLPRVFEPRFSTTTSGTGLGLAICRRLVESWGGTIAVESRAGSGTTVFLSMPGITDTQA